MPSDLIIIPQLTIHPNQIFTYNEYHFTKPHVKHRYDNSSEKDNSAAPEKFLKSSRSANYLVSPNAKKKMNRAIDYLLLMSNTKTFANIYTGRNQQFKIAFVTLTLPSNQIHSDNEIKHKCLNSFLIELKKFYKVKNYVWRSEKQGNGNIHFHILVDKFIPHQEMRDRWNRIVNKLGYVNRYRESQINWHRNGFRVRKRLLRTWPEQKQKEAYDRGSKILWNSPNSTDIHSIREIHNIKEYFSKYMTKNEDNYTRLMDASLEFKVKCSNGPGPGNKNRYSWKQRAVRLKIKRLRKKYENSGRIWGCNTELSKIEGARACMDSNLEQELTFVEKTFKPRKFNDSYFSVFYIDITMLNSGKSPGLFKLFSQFMLNKFNYSIQTEIAA